MADPKTTEAPAAPATAASKRKATTRTSLASAVMPKRPRVTYGQAPAPGADDEEDGSGDEEFVQRHETSEEDEDEEDEEDEEESEHEPIPEIEVSSGSEDRGAGQARGRAQSNRARGGRPRSRARVSRQRGSRTRGQRGRSRRPGNEDEDDIRDLLAEPGAYEVLEKWREGKQLSKTYYRRELPVSKEEATMMELCGPADAVLNDEWSAGDEARFQAEFAESPEHEAFERVRHFKTHPLLTTTRACFHVLECSPFAVISPRHRLWYLKSDMGNPDETVWSQQFCRSFDQLIFNSFWEGSSEHIIMALQYAAICHVDDRHIWHIQDPTDSRVISELKSRVGPKGATNGTLPRSVHQIHREVREEMVRRNRRPSRDSNFLHHLGECIKKRAGDAPQPDGKLLVSKRVLDSVIKALDSFSSRGTFLIPPSQAVQKRYVQTRGGYVPPSSPHVVAKLLKRSWVNELRASRMGLGQGPSANDGLGASDEEMEDAGLGFGDGLDDGGDVSAILESVRLLPATEREDRHRTSDMNDEGMAITSEGVVGMGTSVPEDQEAVPEHQGSALSEGIRRPRRATENRARGRQECSGQASPSNEQTGENTGEQTGEQVGEQTGEQTGAQAREQTGAQATEQTGAQATDQTGAQATEPTGEQVGEQTGGQAREPAGEQVSEEMGGQAGQQAGQQTGENIEAVQQQQGQPLGVDLAGSVQCWPLTAAGAAPTPAALPIIRPNPRLRRVLQTRAKAGDPEGWAPAPPSSATLRESGFDVSLG